MKLYYTPGACSLASNITLHELGLKADVVRVDPKKKLTEHGEDFYAINAKGYVPALGLDDGSVLTEGPAILQYLADQKPEADLVPANGTMARYRLQEWLSYLNSEIHKTFSVYFLPTSTEAEKQAAGERLGKKFDWMQQQLEGKHFLTGETFTVADAYAFTMFGWTAYVGLSLDRWPGLKAYADRIGVRPSVKAAQATEKAPTKA